jgi:ribosome biogenesis protein ERB1
MMKKKAPKEEETPSLSPVDSGSEGGSDEEDSVYDSDVPYYEGDDAEDDEDESEDESEEEFEDQGSSDEDEDILQRQEDDDESDDGMEQLEDNMSKLYETVPRNWGTGKRTLAGNRNERALVIPESGNDKTAQWMHTDDLSSDDEDEDGTTNRIGRVPLHWYDEYDHIGYDAHGKKVTKSASMNGNRVDQALANADSRGKDRFTVHDALNDKNVTLTPRQLELIRRIQGGAYAHPEFDGNAEYIDYYSGVDPELSGINSNRTLPKASFQPSKWDKMQVDELLRKLEKGDINMDYLTGKIRDMNDAHKKNKDKDKPYLLWTGGEEDELNMRKGPQHIAAPKQTPPGHAESYIPPDEYLPTEEEIKQWEEMEVKDRPHGLLIPKKFPNLRSVGAYEHSVREAFERCLDLYLCPRKMKRRLNIDPESLVPKLPKANDLRPFPTAKCIQYKTPYEGDEPPMIRCVAASPDGKYMASGASDGFVRLWEVETARLLKSWDVATIALSTADERDENSGNDTVKPVVALEWNPNRSHHCLLAVVGKCAVIIATGTEGQHSTEVTAALLSSAKRGGNVSSAKAAKAVKWVSVSQKEKPISAFANASGPVCILHTKAEMSRVRWHAKGDYFVTISPKAGAPSVLIHQLSKGNSQQPFSKAKGEVQVACFHPNKPFLFVANQQHVRIYHLVKQAMVKRLISGCRWISSLDIHPSGDHLIVGSLDRRMVWFDLDLSHTPYKTLKYHERAVRAVQFHHRYPLMASASDDGAVHIFHSMVYSDLMRNPLIVPVKILRGHEIKNKHGVLTLSFHPTQPWIFTAGADGNIFLYQDI